MNSSFPILEEYCNYMIVILSRSELTVKEYKYDLISLFRFYKKNCKLVADDIPFDKIDISDIDSKLINKINTDDLLLYLIYITRQHNLKPSSRARKVATIKSFFKYCHTKKHYITTNPAYNLDTPKIGKRLPKHLTLDESKKLLKTGYEFPSSTNERDFCMLTLFLNCGMRLSELRNIDINDIRGTTLTVIGKGNKERTIYLNKACIEALDDYLKIRETLKIKNEHKDALFISKRGTRISDDMIQVAMKRLMNAAGIDTKVFSVHKLRHTAATLMYKYGNTDIRILQEILGHQKISTTEIYTHVDEQQMQDAINLNPLNDFSPEN